MEVFDGKKTKWEGLWWHPESNNFSSAAINLAQLRKFKGNVRIIVKKNRFFNDGENGRPNYVFMIVDSNSDKAKELEIRDEDEARITIQEKPEDEAKFDATEFIEFVRRQLEFM